MGQVGSPPTTPPGLPAEQIQSPASDSQATAATLATTIAEPAQKLAARRLYEQAAAAIAESKPEQAIKPLEALQRQHPDSALSRAVLPHLVECYLAAKRADEALDLLIEHYAAMEQIAVERSQLLGRHACHALPATARVSRAHRWLSTASQDTGQLAFNSTRRNSAGAGQPL